MIMRLLALGPVAMLLAGLLGAMTGGSQARAQNSAEVERVERIVRELLMREPQIILEAIEELQRRELAADAERRRDAIATRADELLRDPATPAVGPDDASVTMVEFFDYRCGFCRRMIPALQRLLAEDPDLRIAFKELPVLGQDSVRAARAALASHAQDGYLDFHFALMAAEDLSQAGIMALAERQGLDVDRLVEDMNAEAVTQAINANYRLARELGIEGTPAFVIGDELVPGAVEHSQLVALIEEARTGCLAC